MDLLVLSDLHLTQNEADDLAVVDPRMADLIAVRDQVNAVVCAGDIMNSGGIVSGLRWLRHYCGKDVDIICTLGNHDYYKSSIPGTIAAAKAEAANLGIHLLENDVAYVDGVRFLGATLWSDFKITGDSYDWAELMNHAKHFSSDFNSIEREEASGRMTKQFSPQDAVSLFEETVSFLDAELASEFDGETVVVTHFAPHPNSIHAEYQHNKDNGCWVSDLSGLIERHSPAAWIHGHTHKDIGYEVGDTQVVCNPRALFSENDKFKWSKTISVSPKPELRL